MTAPLTPLECELLEAVVEERENALAVLGDYWIANVDEERGAFLHLHLGANRERIDLADEEARLAPLTRLWRAPLLAAGYLDRDLELVDGFLQTPLSIPAESPLDGHPDIVRLSPRYYRELRELRCGFEQVVFEAEAITPRTKSRVVMKVARDDYTQRVLDREVAHLSRFPRLAHPNLPRLLGFAVRPPYLDHRETCRAIVLAWHGRDLRALLQSAREANHYLGAAFAISVGVQLLDAVAAIAEVGITHLEVRPDHVLLAADGTVTLIDYGYARSDVPRPPVPISPGLRFDGWRFRYMSPEQVYGVGLDDRTDVFSSAGVISEIVGNEHPLPLGENDFETVQRVTRHLQQASPDLPDQLRAPLQRALALQPQQRPAASELRSELVDGARRARLDIGPHVIAQRLVELGVPA